MTKSTLTTLAGEGAPAWAPPYGLSPKRAGEAVCAFLDVATTSFGRATHYNTREEQAVAEAVAHDGVLAVGRGLYAVLLALPGVTDRALQVGVRRLLASRWVHEGFLGQDAERELVARLVRELPPQRMVKLFAALRSDDLVLGLRRANNARTRRLVLRTILGSEKVVLWAVKYRRRMREALTHAWGKRRTGAVRLILAKYLKGAILDGKERALLRDCIYRYVGWPRLDIACARAHEAVAFALGVREGLSWPLLRAREAAKSDIAEGKILPLEVLEGLRSTYHKNTPKDDVLKLVAAEGRMSKGQRMAVQKRAKAAAVEVAMDPADYDAVRLYLYAYEAGMNAEIASALDEKARAAAARFPARYEKIAIIVDASRSMAGSREQPLRPMAAALALRDVLGHTAETVAAYYVGGRWEYPLPPEGDTPLAETLVAAFEGKPECVFVISDGYENAPAGRFYEVVRAARGMGIETPVYHFNPVLAAESGKTRSLVPEEGLGVSTFPLRDPAALGTAMVRALVASDPVRGINALVRMALGGASGALRIEGSPAPEVEA